MKKFASIIAMLAALSASGFGAFAAEGAESAAGPQRARKGPRRAGGAVKSQSFGTGEIRRRDNLQIRAENRALKKRLRSAKLAAASAETEVPEAKDSKERAEKVERKTEERISEKEAKDDGFHMFPF